MLYDSKCSIGIAHRDTASGVGTIAAVLVKAKFSIRSPKVEKGNVSLYIPDRKM
jgi:hypothetical protein